MKANHFFMLIAFCYVANIALAQPQKDYIDGKVIFKINTEKCKSINDKQLENILNSAKAKNIIQKFPNSSKPEIKTNKYGQKFVDLSTIYEFDTESDIFKVIQELEASGLVEYAQPHYVPQLLFEPNDSLLNKQYHLGKIQAYEAWNIHTGSSSVIVGITDTGTDIDHPDLVYQLAYNENDPIDDVDNDGDGYVDNFRGWDLGCNTNYPQVDAHNHGVWVSGISSAQVNNVIGIAGVGYNCKYLPIKISDSNGALTMAYEGIVYAADHGCSVINCSWGSERKSPFGQDVVDYAIINKDALVIAACGNTNTLTSFYPASYDRVLSVAGTTANDEKWTPSNSGTSGGSSFGYQVDISAPSTGFKSTDNDAGYLTLYGGTSFAAPIVAGVAAIVRSFYPELNALQVAERLKRTTDNIDTIPYNLPYAGLIGTGRVNMYKALTQTFSPSFVFEDLLIEDDRDNFYQNSDTVKIKGKIINYLNPSSNALVHISTTCPYVQLLTDEIILGSVATSQVISLDDECIKFIITDNTPYNTNVILKLEFDDNDYSSIQYLEIPIKPGYKLLDANNINIAITGNGRFGFEDNYGRFGTGMHYKNFEDLFYDCGLIVGNSSNNLFCSVRQESDFKTIEYPQFVEPPLWGNLQIISSFSDSCDMSPIGLVIVQNAYAWKNDPNKDFFIVSYDIINKSFSSINNLYAGIFADFDLLISDRNKAKYDYTNKYIYTEYTGEHNLYTGFKLLSNHSENHYALEQVVGGDGLVDLTDGFNDSERFYMLSNSRDITTNNESGSDVVMMISAGPFNLSNNDTAHIAFAFIASESKFTLNQAAQNAQVLYNQMINNSGVYINNRCDIVVYPNPAKNRIYFSHYDGAQRNNFDIVICDLSGKIVLKQNNIDIINGVDISSLQLDGIYVLKLIKDDFVQNIKLIIKN